MNLKSEIIRKALAALVVWILPAGILTGLLMSRLNVDSVTQNLFAGLVFFLVVPPALFIVLTPQGDMQAQSDEQSTSSERR